MNFDGKVANQPYKAKLGGVLCERCRKLIKNPEINYTYMKIDFDYCEFRTFNFINRPEFIYESKSGYAVCYCSKYCRNKHNHRFKVKK